MSSYNLLLISALFLALILTGSLIYAVMRPRRVRPTLAVRLDETEADIRAEVKRDHRFRRN